MLESEVAQLRKKIAERVNQWLQRLRDRLAIWWLQAIRLGLRVDHEALESSTAVKAVCAALQSVPCTKSLIEEPFGVPDNGVFFCQEQERRRQ